MFLDKLSVASAATTDGGWVTDAAPVALAAIGGDFEVISGSKRTCSCRHGIWSDCFSAEAVCSDRYCNCRWLGERMPANSYMSLKAPAYPARRMIGVPEKLRRLCRWCKRNGGKHMKASKLRPFIPSGKDYALAQSLKLEK